MHLALVPLLALGPGTEPTETIDVPRIEADVTVDGALDEPAWSNAVLLRGFSTYLPVDGRPAEDSTHVLVWYSATAIHFGIRAYEVHGTVQATLADRDKIGSDDFVQILLDTFDDRRQAFLFGVNPLGVQADGILRDAARQTSAFGHGGGGGAYSVDLNPDYVFESTGRVTPTGYEIEVRIPFKSLRFQASEQQDWGLNVIRRVQHSGYENTWSPVLQSDGSFLAKNGTLAALTGMSRGLVLDLNPEMTSNVSGAPEPAGPGWNYDTHRPEIGGNVRLGITNNLFLTATANPDFSQVEADVAQISADPRRALFFPEKRPFFLDGLEQFNTPNSLIYTRRLASPEAAVKLTGKVSNTNLAFLSGVDDRDVSATGSHPVYNWLRVKRDVLDQSTVGFAYTDRIDGDDYNRVLAADTRLQLGAFDITLQGGGSATRTAGVSTTAPLWEAQVNRAGRRFGFTSYFRGSHPDFRAGSGFISRVGIVHAGFQPRLTFFGNEGSVLESWTGSVTLDGTWVYDRFFDGRTPSDSKLHLNGQVTLRGGWRLGTSVLIESFKYPPELYTNYFVERNTAGVVDTVPFVGTDRLSNLDLVFNFSTPQFQTFSANGFVVYGRDENFFEWAPADILIAILNANWRPTEQLRFDLRYQHWQYMRPSDGSNAGLRRVPRLKAEYQLTRAIFLRVVGQYDANFVDDLRDNSRTDDPILFQADDGTFTPAVSRTRNDFQVDWLFSFRPNPGTVLFAGYGASLDEPRSFRFSDLGRRQDGFFVKLSYLWRV